MTEKPPEERRAGPTLHFRSLTQGDGSVRVAFFVMERGERLELGWIDSSFLHAAGEEGRLQWICAMERLYGSLIAEMTGAKKIELWRSKPGVGRRKANPNPGQAPERSQPDDEAADQGGEGCSR